MQSQVTEKAQMLGSTIAEGAKSTLDNLVCTKAHLQQQSIKITEQKENLQKAVNDMIM
jgi:hypothetical protein